MTNGGFPERLMHFTSLEQRMITEGIVAHAHLPLAADRATLGDVAWLEMVHHKIGEKAGLVAVHACHGAGQAVPAAFRNRDQAAQTLKALPAEKLDRSRHIDAVAGKSVARQSDIDDHAAGKTECGLGVETRA